MSDMDMGALREKMNSVLVLTPEQREQAKRQAGEIIKSGVERPNREHYINATISEYPAWFTRMIIFGVVILFVAAALPSFFRLYTAGRDYFMYGGLSTSAQVTGALDANGNVINAMQLSGIQDQTQGAIVGSATFLLAEFMIIMATLAREILFANTPKRQRLLLIPIGLGMGMALIGNYVVELPKDAFGWLMTLTPPVAVLVTAFLLERIVVDSIRTRQANENAYRTALTEYEQRVENPTEHKDFLKHYAQYLKIAIEQANSVGKGASQRIAILNDLTYREWTYFIQRELAHENGMALASVELDDDMLTGGISQRRALGSGGVQRFNEQKSFNAEQKVFNEQNEHTEQRKTPKFDAVMAHLHANPNDADLPVRALAKQLNVSVGLISNAVNTFKQQSS